MGIPLTLSVLKWYKVRDLSASICAAVSVGALSRRFAELFHSEKQPLGKGHKKKDRRQQLTLRVELGSFLVEFKAHSLKALFYLKKVSVKQFCYLVQELKPVMSENFTNVQNAKPYIFESLGSSLRRVSYIMFLDVLQTRSMQAHR